MKDDDVAGVQEGLAKVLCHELRGEPLAARDDILGRAALDLVDELVETLSHGKRKSELLDDVKIAPPYLPEEARAVDVVLDVGVHEEQQIGDLVVIAEAPTYGRDHHEAAVRVTLDDGLNLPELLGISDARAAELCDLDHAPTPPWGAPP